jgi:HAD superfamily hydrolase (TIGR01509 family)
MLARIRAVAFDLDGVLLDTETINVRAAFEAFAAAGAPLRPEDAAEIVGRHPVDYGPVLARRRGLPEEALPGLQLEQGVRYATIWRRDAVLLPGAREAIEAARGRGLPTALATSSGRAGVEEALTRFDLRDAFDVVLTKDDVTQRKPDPEIYMLAAERLGVRPPALLVLEDSEFGVRAALAAGTYCVAVASPYTPAESVAGAQARVESLGQLERWFEEGRFG